MTTAHHDHGWGVAHGKTPEQQTIIAARKLATAAREYLEAGTGRHRDALVETLAQFDRHVHAEGG